MLSRQLESEAASLAISSKLKVSYFLALQLPLSLSLSLSLSVCFYSSLSLSPLFFPLNSQRAICKTLAVKKGEREWAGT